jgi:hypothetical protein
MALFIATVLGAVGYSAYRCALPVRCCVYVCRCMCAECPLALLAGHRVHQVTVKFQCRAGSCGSELPCSLSHCTTTTLLRTKRRRCDDLGSCSNARSWRQLPWSVAMGDPLKMTCNTTKIFAKREYRRSTRARIGAFTTCLRTLACRMNLAVLVAFRYAAVSGVSGRSKQGC